MVKEIKNGVHTENGKILLISKTPYDVEVRVAVITKCPINKDNFILEDMYIDVRNTLTRGNIFKGIIHSVQPALQAFFVDIGSGKHGFLPFDNIPEEYCKSIKGKKEWHENTIVSDILEVGQPILVQIDQEERGYKGASLTCMISIAGCYLVLMPYNTSSNGVSKRIDGEERDQLKEVLKNISKDDLNIGLIARTASINQSEVDIKNDFDILMGIWDNIQNSFKMTKPPCLIYEDGDVVLRALRDLAFPPGTDSVVIDSSELFERAKTHTRRWYPLFMEKISFFNQKSDLFTYYGIDYQIQQAFAFIVNLPSGGSIVFDSTEAMTTVDVNSSRDIKGKNVEETALNTNLEAVVAIARHLRLRNIGGLIVIDFIDMKLSAHCAMVEAKFKSSIVWDRARISFGTISKFGILEVSRQRIRITLNSSAMVRCSKCYGHGMQHSVESVVRMVFRNIWQIIKNNLKSIVHVYAPIDVCTFIINEKRFVLQEMESQCSTKIVILPVKDLDVPSFRVELADDGDLSPSFTYLDYKKNNNNFYKKSNTKALKLPSSLSKEEDNFLNSNAEGKDDMVIPIVKKIETEKPQNKSLFSKIIAIISDSSYTDVVHHDDVSSKAKRVVKKVGKKIITKKNELSKKKINTEITTESKENI
jgi:ribonuclease E